MDYATMMQGVSQMAAAAYHSVLPDGQLSQRPMYSFTYSSDPLYLVPQMAHRSAADVQLGLSKHTEPKPRLAKDEVDLLENEFKENPKPSSQRKREIAEMLKVENPRINNWFQNRRAKAKQMLRREMDIRPGDESPPEALSDHQEECNVSEYYSSSNHSQPLRASSAAFPTLDQQQQPFYRTKDVSTTSSASPSVEEYPSPRSLVFPPTHDLTYPVISGYITQNTSPSHTDMDEPALHEFDQPLGAFVPFHSMSMEPAMEPVMAPLMAPQAVMPYHSELLAVDNMPHLSEEVVLRCDTQIAQTLPQHSLPNAIQQLSSPISTHSPSSAASDLRFKSPPPPANIASRRNKGVPAMLNPTAFRNGPYGPKTGVEMTKRIDTASPIRRINSANGLINRIQKPTMASVPRSPLYFERNKEALMHSLQTATAAAVGAPVALTRSVSSNVSPVTPREVMVPMHPDMSEMTAPLGSDDEPRYDMSASVPHPFFAMGQTLRTPPGTPGFNGCPVDQRAMDPWSYVPQDEALLTPSFGSYGSDEFPVLSTAPAYVGSSQPATPSYSQPAGANYFPLPYRASAMGHAEYTFPGETNLPGYSAKSSPDRPKGVQFQFAQNITPDDFFSIEK